MISILLILMTMMPSIITLLAQLKVTAACNALVQDSSGSHGGISRGRCYDLSALLSVWGPGYQQARAGSGHLAGEAYKASA